MYLEDFETTGDDFMERCNWDTPLKEKTRQPVAANGHDAFSMVRACVMVDLAWFDDPYRPAEVPLWDEVAKAKMRQPVRAHGNHPLYHDELILKLMTFSSFF